MQQYHRVAIIVWVALFFLPAASPGVPLPEGLRSTLRVHNFNTYSVPCPANDLALQNVRGGTISLSALRGKVVILNFWKIDCPPCMSEKPVLERIFRKYSPRGLAIVAANLFDNYERIKSFANKSAFSFALCGDSDGRLSVRSQPLPGGTPTTFVVNTKSEAIYEVPAVPTTYLIDRSGNVVGNSVGMVNWEEPALCQLLECLLEPGRTRVAQADHVFSDAAQQGVPPSGMQTGSGPTQQGPIRGPQKFGEPADEIAPTAGTGGSEAVNPASGPEERGGSTQRTGPQSSRIAKPENNPTSEQPRSREKSDSAATRARLAQTQRQYATPKPYSPPSGAAPRPYTPPQRSASSQPAPPALPGPSVASPQPTLPIVPGGSGSALPPALPYTPPRLTRQAPGSQMPITPNQDGTVVARVPQQRTPQLGQAPNQAAPAYDTGSAPLARPETSRNLLRESILDSFGTPAPRSQFEPPSRPPQPIPPPREAEAEPEQPAASIFSQVSRDFRNLGEGIGDVFSRIWPGSK
ncbi:MAG: redoxin domain-containing protein [Thermodesulfobacteriota bacterium]